MFKKLIIHRMGEGRNKKEYNKIMDWSMFAYVKLINF